MSLVSVVVGMNVMSFFVYGWDKWRAVTGGGKRKVERVSEKVLWRWMGAGPIGGVVGMWVWRHKVSKWSFKWRAGLWFLMGMAIYCGAGYLIVQFW